MVNERRIKMKYLTIFVTLVTLSFAQMNGEVKLAPSVVNISNWTWGGGLDQQAYLSGWGMPIKQQISITREDQIVQGLLHTNSWDYGFNQSYTFNQIGAQTTFEFGKVATFGQSSPGAITRPIQNNGWNHFPPINPIQPK